jgi:murein L,D-transpeptidase YcbB/YkuD
MKLWKSVLVVVLISVLISGAWPQSQPQTQPAQPPAAGAGSTQETIVSSKDAKALFRSVDEILQFASQDTGLPIQHKVKRRLTKRDEVQSYIEKSMKDDKDAKRLERSSAVLKKFGLIPRDFDLSKFLVTMLREQVAGYYDVKTKTVNLLNWVDAEQQKPVLAHELTHALQDQSFSIEKWMKGSTEAADNKNDNKKSDPSPADIANDEESSARQAVIEGQAMVVLLDYSLASTGKTMLDAPQIVEALKQGMLTGTADSPAFRDAPIFLKEELTFPYRYGLDFTAALLQAGGKELAYAGAFKAPPKTTREIMEPETYLTHEKLEPLKMIDMEKDFNSYDPFDIGAMGEFDVDVLVEQYAGRDEAGAMYPEWRGGYYFAGKPKGDKSAPIGVLYVSRWSSPAKAAEFAAVYAKSLAQRYQKRQGLGTDGKVAEDAPPVDSWRTLRGRHAWLTEEGVVLIEVRGDEILISESLDDETTKKVEADFWPAEQSLEKAAPGKQ